MSSNRDSVQASKYELQELITLVSLSKSQAKRLSVQQRHLRDSLGQKYFDVSKMSRINEENEEKIHLLKNDIKFLKFQISVRESHPFIQKSKIFDFHRWMFDRDDEYLEKERLGLTEEMERFRKSSKMLQNKSDSLNSFYKSRLVK